MNSLLFLVANMYRYNIISYPAQDKYLHVESPSYFIITVFYS